MTGDTTATAGPLMYEDILDLYRAVRSQARVTMPLWEWVLLTRGEGRDLDAK